MKVNEIKKGKKEKIMNFKKCLFNLGSALILTAALTGCTSTNEETESIFNPNQETPIETPSSRNDSLVAYEMMFNYDLLDLFYSYSHSNNELGDFEEYYNAKSFLNDIKGRCSPSFAKVCNMYSHMSDNFTRYFDPLFAAAIMSYLSSSEEVVGMGISVKEEGSDDATVIVVDFVVENSPADKSGLMVGDTIVSIDGTPINSLNAFNKLATGDKGEKVSVNVMRNGSEVSLKVILDAFALPTVFLSYEDSIPVIHITEFTASTVDEDGTYGEFVRVLKKIKDDNEAAIIDLRGNPGGDVDHCNRMSAELLNEGDTIIVDVETNVDSVRRNGEWEYFQKFDTTVYTAEYDGIGKDLYYVFLADSGSASCAEVMLSAITVNKKSPVVGLTTYGKGIGQYVIPTYADGLALITGLQSMDKNGNIYHKVGIVPDFISGDEDEQMAQAIEWAKERKKERRTTGFYGDKSTGHFAKAKALDASIKKFPTNRKELLNQMSGAYRIRKHGK